ncbi:MAG: signal peptidase I [Desulfotomaculum sp.]|nr:signal peptidase I [Desulfotomaculum sp.]
MKEFDQETIETKEIEPKKKKSSLIRETLESIVIAVILAIVIRMFIVEPFYIPSGSMEPTLLVNDRIIVSKISYHLGGPAHGDVVVFRYPDDTSRNFVKRLIAVPGDTVELRDSNLHINGNISPENYLFPTLQFADYGPTTVPDGYYFMLGDNRNSSEDSRSWGFMSEDLIIGKSVLIYWPLERFRLID